MFLWYNFQLNCNFGEGARKLMVHLDGLEKKNLSRSLVEALAVASKYLIKGLPITIQVVADAKHLHPSMQTSKNAPSAIRRLSSTILSTFPGDFITKEFQSVSSNVEMVTDQIMSEFTKYQLEAIPKSYFEEQSNENKSSSRVQYSYWKHAYGIAEVERTEPDMESCYTRIDKYWSKVRL